MSPASSPPTPEELSRLPIFPLPEVVLFPNTLLPLHIFEPRYRDMMAWALETERPIVIAQLKPGFEETYFDHPPIHAIAGAGRLHHHARRPDGRYDLILHGVARVKLEEELVDPDVSFRTGRFSIIDDSCADPHRAETQINTLKGLGMGLLPCRPRLAAVLGELLHAPVGADHLSNLLCSLLLPCGDTRQAALECTHPTDRLEAVISTLVDLLPQAESCSDLS